MSEERMRRTEEEVEPDAVKTSKKDNGSTRLYRVVYALLSGIIGLLFRVKIIGRENEPSKGGFVVCANHTSATDPVVLCYAFRKHQVRFMAKKELFKVPIVSWAISLLGAFPVDRAGNDVGAIKKAVAMVKDGKCMGIFPQGHRYPGVDPRSTETKNGAALISVKAEADIIPAYIVRRNNKQSLFCRTWVIIGEPIKFSELQYDAESTGEYARISEFIFDRICSLGEGLSEKELKAVYKEQKKARKAQKRGGKV